GRILYHQLIPLMTYWSPRRRRTHLNRRDGGLLPLMLLTAAACICECPIWGAKFALRKPGSPCPGRTGYPFGGGRALVRELVVAAGNPDSTGEAWLTPGNGPLGRPRGRFPRRQRRGRWLA